MRTLDADKIPTESKAGRARPCISIYVPAPPDDEVSPPDPSRLEELLGYVEQELELRRYPPETIRELMAPLYEFCASCDSSQLFGQNLALFRKPGFFRHHSVSFSIPEVAVVSDRFHLTPLFNICQRDQKFYLLTLSLTGAKLLEGQSGAIAEVSDIVFPPSPATHAGQPGDQEPGRIGSTQSILHRRQGRDNRKQALSAWFRRVDEVMRARLGGGCPPVVLVAVQYLCPMFRHVSRYPNLVEREIHGSPDAFAPADLWQRGRDIASSTFRAERQNITDEYLKLWHTPRASNDLRDIEVAARHGRVQTLFIGIQTSALSPAGLGSSGSDAPGETDDNLELAALNTFLTGGTVYAVSPEEVPGRGAAAAVFRY